MTRDPPALVSVMQVNNETGAVSDIPRLSAMLRALAPQALLHVDGVQAFLRLPIDGNLVDMYTCLLYTLEYKHINTARKKIRR